MPQLFVPGTIVTVARQPGYWAVADLAVTDIPPLGRWRLLGNRIDQFGTELQTSRVVASGDIAVVAEPEFHPGQSVEHYGIAAEVVSDKPDEGLVRIRQTTLRNPRLGGTHTGVSDVSRGNLALENLHSILNGGTNGD